MATARKSVGTTARRASSVEAPVRAAARPRAAPAPAPAAPEQPAVALRSPQDGPIVFRTVDNRLVASIKVDSVRRRGRLLEIEGWLIGDAALAVRCETEVLEHTWSRSSRPDVAAAMGVAESGPGFGFAISTLARDGAHVLDVEVRLGGQVQARSFPLRLDRPALLGPGGKAGAVGHLEAGVACSATTDGVVVGWAVQEPGARVWLETDDGVAVPVSEGLRTHRDDVLALHGATFGASARRSAFVVRVTGVGPGSRVRLVGEKDSGPVVISEIGLGALAADPVAASQWLFGIPTPTSEFIPRLEYLDFPILDTLIRIDRATWHELPVQQRVLGAPVADPEVSLVVPLYARSDFVEHQLIEFSRDPWLMAHGEVIYVVDDPRLVEPFHAQAETLFRLYQVPFRWIWGGANRGYSGANNLGAQHARGRHLVFMNSDVIPQQPGWGERLVDWLQRHPEAGAVGPRLTFADGSIQHAGMAFAHRGDLGIWINEHPQMGLDPSLDRFDAPVTMPAITGACVALRRQDFDAIGGWDTGYLIGDFEDSDLCLKLRHRGLQVVYLPDVQLTHLERQSFRTLGEGEYRTRVVVYNAARHQARWRPLLAPTFEHQPAGSL